MTIWPDASFALLERYVDQLDYRGPRSRRPCASVLRRFQRFVMKQAAKPILSQAVIAAWLRAEVQVSPLPMVIRRAQIVDTFLDWLVSAKHLRANPFAELRESCRPRGTRSIVPALLGEDPEAALVRLRSIPRFGSCIGSVLRDHVARMRTLGYRCDEDRFLRFDRFAQLRPGAAAAPLPVLMQAYAAEGGSPAVRYEHLRVARILARALHRVDPSAPVPPAYDPMVKRAMFRQRRRPYIYSLQEIACLLRTARVFPSPHAPLRPQTLYTMILLAYCAGLRIGELVRLQLRDFQLGQGTLDIRETKFFKSRRLPLKPSVVAALKGYLGQRTAAGIPQPRDGPFFCHGKGGYADVTVEHLLTLVIRGAGLKPKPGRCGPRVHDLRHTFVVHRMLAWYEQGINPQSRLPYLSTYLGHRDIHSTLVYLTITQELLALANERYRLLGVSALAAEGGNHVHDAVTPAPAAGLLSRVAGSAAGRVAAHGARLPRHLAVIPPQGGQAAAVRGRRSHLR